MKVKCSSGSLALWALSTAIGEQTDVIDKLNFDNGGEHEINLIVDGVELNFMNIMTRIDEMYSTSVDARAKEMIMERCEDLSDCVDQITSYVAAQCAALFPKSADY